ncbi:MAG TPA: hypothetical protein VEY94_06660, partial [Patescibacteria group bacterium]|nr:hypothetical protein [Patescibacteria group bacterium]
TSLSDLLLALGYPDQSLHRAYEAVKAVSRESDPFSYAMALVSAVQAHCFRHEAAKAVELCNELINLCTEHGFPYWLGIAQNSLGWAMVLQGRVQEGIAIMNEQLDQVDEADPELRQFNLLPILAEAYGDLGEFDKGLAALEKWLAVRNRYSATGIDRLYCRVRGELLMKAGSIEEAEESLRKSIQLSAGQSAKLEQLRATTRLARLLAGRGQRQEARAMLAEVYNSFTEGLDTADLKDAKALLDELNGTV